MSAETLSDSLAVSARQALQTYFGYDAFRPGQQDVVTHLLGGGDVLCVMPTGAGKSVCYQIPALLFTGVTLVISPLISLMSDQVRALKQAGIPAGYLNSTLTSGQYSEALRRAGAGAYKILYVAPERLSTESFRRFACRTPISFVAVDEAHCISQWGQNFRPEYLRIAEFISLLPHRPVLGAFTATATPAVKQDIVKLLELRDPFSLTTSFDRENLYFAVMHPDSRDQTLLQLLREEPDSSAIVYCSTRKTVEEVQQMLCRNGVSAARYHAGLEREERQKNQEDFLYDRCRVMVATNAFGMGIDKSDVRLVIHYNMPKDMESYYQEAGRAGRDGAPARCILLYQEKDVRVNQFLIDRGNENGELDEKTFRRLRQREMERLFLMQGYCNTTNCLRQTMLQYFGQLHSGRCGACSNCRDAGVPEDVTTAAQMILSCVIRMGERYGRQLVIHVLRGSREARVRQLGFDSLSTYGLLKRESEQRVRGMIRVLLTRGLLREEGSEYRILTVTQQGRDFLRSGEQLIERVPSGRGVAASASEAVGDEEPDPVLLEQLRVLRREIALYQSVPSFVVFTDATLRDMCRKKPRTPDQLLSVSGVGSAKAKRYGERFLNCIRAYLAAEE